MYSIWKFYSHLLLVVLAFQQIKADCNVCAVVSNTACIAQDQYQRCVNGVPIGDIMRCREGLKCSVEGRCDSDIEKEEVSCLNCGDCNSDNTFACTGTKTFSLCLGINTTSEITGVCSDNNVCNINNRNICGTAEEGYPATCSYTDDSTTPPPATTPSPETQPNQYCAAIDEEGRFPVGTNPETTCQEYVRCYKTSSDEWVGVRYRCPGATYFSSATRGCSKDRPARCGGTVGSLALYNLQLN